MTEGASESAPVDAVRNLPHLAQALRGGGVRLGTGSLLLAAEALAGIDLARRSDVRAALRATLIIDPADFELFEQLFEALFPSDMRIPPGSNLRLPRSQSPTPAPAQRRLAQALVAAGTVRSATRREQREIDASGTASDVEVLQRKDFEQMSAAELESARELLRLAPPRRSWRRTRRLIASGRGARLDLRRMMRAGLKGPDFMLPRFQTERLRPRDWVLLVDVSGSMSTYSRMFLQFAHALSKRSRGLETFAFSTHLTRLSRALRPIDPDRALQAVSSTVGDWDGGTRIGECLAEFNYTWSRRVLSRGASVVLLTDGLERASVEQMEAEVRRLARSCRELLWINPLMRSASYAPLAAGASVLDRYATYRCSAHNVASLVALARLLDRPDARQNS